MSIEEPRTNGAAVAIRLPPFCQANPRICSIQADVQFSRLGITASRMKYEEIVCALPTEYATQVQDLLLHPPENNPFEKLKNELTCA